MLAQRNLYMLLRGRRRIDAQTFAQRCTTLPGYDGVRTQDLRADLGNLLVAFTDGSYLAWCPPARTWIAFHERWNNKEEL